jgi:hypothetical protein
VGCAEHIGAPGIARPNALHTHVIRRTWRVHKDDVASRQIEERRCCREQTAPLCCVCLKGGRQTQLRSPGAGSIRSGFYRQRTPGTFPDDYAGSYPR